LPPLPELARLDLLAMDIYLQLNGKTVGPFSRTDLQGKLREGAVRSDCMAWHEGLDNWLPLRDILGRSCPNPNAPDPLAGTSRLSRRSIFRSNAEGGHPPSAEPVAAAPTDLSSVGAGGVAWKKQRLDYDEHRAMIAAELGHQETGAPSNLRASRADSPVVRLVSYILVIGLVIGVVVLIGANLDKIAWTVAPDWKKKELAGLVIDLPRAPWSTTLPLDAATRSIILEEAAYRTHWSTPEVAFARVVYRDQLVDLTARSRGAGQALVDMFGRAKVHFAVGNRLVSGLDAEDFFAEIDLGNRKLKVQGICVAYKNALYAIVVAYDRSHTKAALDASRILRSARIVEADQDVEKKKKLEVQSSPQKEVLPGPGKGGEDLTAKPSADESIPIPKR
jgi:hypothetical protein